MRNHRISNRINVAKYKKYLLKMTSLLNLYQNKKDHENECITT